MSGIKLFDPAFGLLERALDVRFKRHAVLAGNVANSETPQYRARELDFEGELNRAYNESVGGQSEELARTNPLHMDLGSQDNSHIIYDTSGPVGSDGNNVDLDGTMGKISENSRGYNAAADYMTIKFRLLKQAARNGGGSI